MASVVTSSGKPYRSLLVTPITASSLASGGGQRTFHLCRALAALGEVDLLVVSEEELAVLEASFRPADFPAGRIVVQRSTPQCLVSPKKAQLSPWERAAYAVQRVGWMVKPRSHFYRASDEARSTLMQLLETSHYDVLVARYLRGAALAGAFDQRTVPVVVDLDDIDEALIQSRIGSRTTSPVKKLLLWNQLRQTQSLAPRLRARCRHVFAASEADRIWVDHPSSSVLPNIALGPAGDGQFVAEPAADQDCVVLFVGSHGSRMNREGVFHFIERCWPSIRTRVRKAHLRIVGSGGWETEQKALQNIDGVEVVGAVPDLHAEYRTAAFCIAPVFEGAGTKIKILEALLYGRAVVATRHAARGLEGFIGSGVSQAVGDYNMIDQCVQLLEQPPMRDQGVAKGRELTRASHSFDRVVEAVREGLVAAGVLPMR